MKVDYLIVGLGLAGLAFSEQLKKNKRSFIVFEDASQQSSMVAGGVFNPVILKRFTPVWKGHKQLQLAIPFYKQLEQDLNKQVVTEFKTLKIFNSIADENNWFTALDNPILSKYMLPNIIREKKTGVIGDWGYGELKGTGWVNTKKLLTSYKEKLKAENKLITQTFNHKELVVTNSELNYHEVTASKIVFCEGFGLKKNPFFNFLPIKESKGETIEIYAPDLKIDCQLKSSVFIFPLGKDMYKVGATFNWTDKTSIPTEKGRHELEEKLKKVINVPYKIINQSAGIRPTVKDRRPLVGVHPKYSNVIVLNGLGTRGVMIAPSVAENLYNHLENGEELNKDINIKRFRN